MEGLHLAALLVVLADQAHQGVLEVGHVLGLPDQHHLEDPVVQGDLAGREDLEAAHRVGVGDHAVDEVPLQGAAVVLHRQVVAPAQVPQLGGGLQHVGQVAEGALELLGGVVAHVGEDAEGGHVDEGPVVEAAHVAGPGRPLRRHGRRLLHPTGQAQVLGEVVGGAGGNIAQHRRRVQGEQPRHRLAEGAVPAAADHPVIPPALPGGHMGGVGLALGGPHRHQIARLGKNVHHIGQMGLDDPLAGLGIVDEEQSFHVLFLRRV